MNANKFSPDPRWAMHCRGYHIQARPNCTTIEAMVALQQSILAMSPLRLHLIPPDAIHVSVVTLLPADCLVQKVEEAWTWLNAHISDDMRALVELKAPLVINFTRLAFSPQAITIATSEQPHPIDVLRRTFGGLLSHLGLPIPLYNQTHVTLARYAEDGSVSPEKITSALELYTGLIGRFEVVRFVRERRYPSLTTDIL